MISVINSYLNILYAFTPEINPEIKIKSTSEKSLNSKIFYLNQGN